MHLVMSGATVTDSENIYSNAFVEFDSADDEIATVRVANRQGVTLLLPHGTFEPIGNGAGWIVHTETGDVTVVPDPAGCGCGGTSITPRGVQDG